ncbi:hypothetical protein LWI28_004084 [Acer negundo]|uniref:SLH domain-containing protein n=1 Tax=Acer negundo TaxID=4023 RepID=A0AAD5NM09_ACENE|nr:hypothetical protein LWI28_004084 [Acer negundo]
MNSSTATSTSPSSLFLRRRTGNVPIFTCPTYFRPRNSKLLRLSASLAQLSWSSPPRDNNNYNGWAIVESTPDIRTKKGLSTVVIGGVVGSSLAFLLAAISYVSLSRKGFKFQFSSPLNALHDILNRNERTIVEFDEMDGDTIASPESVSNDTSDTFASGTVDKLERVIVSVAIDSTQQDALSVLKKLKILEDDVMADELCTRREYARWLVRTNSLLESNPKHRIVPSVSLSGTVIAAFDDVDSEDPDFESIQALAEAGVVPSKLSGKNSGSDGSKGQGGVYFLPERFISRQDLINWKAQVEYELKPDNLEQISRTKVDYMDVKEISSDASPELFMDILAGDKSIVRRVFGQSKRFQPNKPSTKAQAAVALTSGRMTEAICIELLRLDAERSSKQAEMEEIRSELLDRGDIKRSWDEKLNEERTRGSEVEKLYASACDDLEQELIVQEKNCAVHLKEKAAMDCQRQLLLNLKEEVDEMSERLESERAMYVTEKRTLQDTLSELQTRQEGLLDAKSILEAEKEAFRILRSWVEDEARKSQARAKVLEEVSRRLGFLVAASIAAFAVKQRNLKPSNSSNSGNREANDGKDKQQLTYSNDSLKEKKWEEEEEEEEEEVKLISSIFNQSRGSPPDIDDEDFLPEFEDLLSGEIEYPFPTDKFDEAEKDIVYETEIANNSKELERLRNLVKELEEREEKLEGELLEYYGLKEQESDIVELQRQLKIKTVEIDMLNITINSLQAERKKLQEEITKGVSAKKELEVAQNKIKELQRQIQLDANQTKGQLLLLKQQVSSLLAKEKEAINKEAEVEKKLKSIKELEVEVVELKRKNKELQIEKRELTIKLDAAEARIATLSNMTETEMVAKVREEVNNMRHANEDLLKQVEGLQMNRFSEVEELVYLRWVNACLRFELRNYQTPAGKTSARDLSKDLSPKSQERAKQLMLEYAGSERGQGDTDVESNFSHPSSPGSEDFDNVSIDSSTSRYSSLSKKPSLIQKLKKWGGKSKDDSSALSSPARSFSGGSPSRMSMSYRPRGPLEALMLKNASDSVAITSFGKLDQETTDSPETPNLPHIRTRVPSSDSLNNVSESFQLMSKSVEGVLEEKYPAYKDRHKLALEREKQIKEKAEQARTIKFRENSKYESKPKGERGLPAALPPKLALIKEKPVASVDSSDQPNHDKAADTQTISKMKLAQLEKRPPRAFRPPPKPSGGAPVGTNSNLSSGLPSGPPPPPPPPGAPLPPPPPGGPPRPPPPPGSLSRGVGSGDKVHRAPELVEFYQSLMKREAKKDTSSLISTTSNISDARSNMIGEIENRSSFLLAVKADVETQGDFVQSLAAEVRAASFSNIQDLVTFVNWLDEELSFLVDERAVLKHFDWPEGKTDALREAAFEYQDLMKLENQVSTFVDDPNLPCESALKKMYKLLEKVEQSVYALLRTRDMAMSRYKEFGIPVNWLMDSGVVGKIKLSSVQLARKYMKRVSTELDAMDGPEKEPNREFLLLQGVRFAFRVHQFAGGFDAESMKAFEELRSRVHTKTGEDQKPEA